MVKKIGGEGVATRQRRRQRAERRPRDPGGRLDAACQSLGAWIGQHGYHHRGAEREECGDIAQTATGPVLCFT